MTSKLDSWLQPGEVRGWACDACGRSGAGLPRPGRTPPCPGCGSRELYRVGLRPCLSPSGCPQAHTLLADGRPAHARIG